MAHMDEQKSAELSTVSSNLFALECLATTAGQLHESEKQMKQSDTILPQQQTIDNNEEEKSNKVPVVKMAPISSVESSNVPLPPMSFNNFYSPFSQPSSTARPLTDFTFPPPFSHAPFRNFMDLPMPPSSSFGIKMEDVPWNRPVLPQVISSSHDSNEKKISSDTAKSAFDIVPKRHNVLSSPQSSSSYDVPHSSYQNSEVTMSNTNNIPQQPPMLFHIDHPNNNNNSLLETLVQESQKILSSQEEQNNQGKPEITFPETKNENNRKEPDQASKTNDDFKRAREMVLISPQKKSSRKQRNGMHPVSDVKRAYGGPPFKPGYPPPAVNTSESAMCCLYEHTLLKMATRGFWSGDRGPLQDVFRLSRVENSDLQYNMKAITKHCYNVVRRKLENAEEDKVMMHKHMRNYVDEFDSYLNRIYPVSSIAINLYLPTAADYSVATWHGIVPTGWSEYRRAVIIREVFEVLYHLSSNLNTLPEYNSKFFDKSEPDTTLTPIPLETFKKKQSSETTAEDNAEESEIKDQNNNENPEESNNDAEQFDSMNVKYSRAFEALWTRTSPHEPYLILKDLAQLKLREYLENFPIEVYAPTEETLIVVDEKKYKAKNILGFFRRGVQLVDYSKDTGSMVIDTISTLRNVSSTSAVRKIPPGRISKLVHPDLHLENYTNAIHQVGSNGLEADGVRSMSSRPPKVRRRRGKNRNSGDMKEEKVKKRRTKAPQSEPSIDEMSSTNEQFFSSPPPVTPTPMAEKLDSIESICNSMKMEGVDDKVFSTPITQHFPTFSRPASVDDVKTGGSEQPASLRTNHADMNHSVESMLPKESSGKVSNSYLVNQHTQTLQDSPALNKSDMITPNLFSPDILSPMYLQQQQQQQQNRLQPPFSFSGCPPGPPDQQRFSLHLMIDSYRRAAKYLLDTANHLELVARHGNHGNTNSLTEKDVAKKEKPK